eukprot:1116160-Prymnesium_polylepis.1
MKLVRACTVTEMRIDRSWAITSDRRLIFSTVVYGAARSRSAAAETMSGMGTFTSPASIATGVFVGPETRGTSSHSGRRIVHLVIAPHDKGHVERAQGPIGLLQSFGDVLRGNKKISNTDWLHASTAREVWGISGIKRSQGELRRRAPAGQADEATASYIAGTACAVRFRAANWPVHVFVTFVRGIADGRRDSLECRG